MKRLFITASFQGLENKAEIEKLCDLVRKSGWEDFCFIRDIENYQKIFSNPHDLTLRSLAEIRKSDALLIDLTDKPTGRAYEAGMAYALGKTIIVILKKGIQVKATTLGIASHILHYDNLEDITEQLKALA